MWRSTDAHSRQTPNSSHNGTPARPVPTRPVVTPLLAIAACGAWAGLPWVLWRLRAGLAGTTLTDAWGWLATAWLAWALEGAASVAGAASEGWLDLAWYAVAVLALAPPVAVLGARRPLHRAWPWFVLVPLLLVFAWPVAAPLAGGAGPVGWGLETPLLAGYLLVLVMGAGNYVGLKHTLSALLWVAGLALLIGSLCPLTAARLPGTGPCRALATLLVASAGWLAFWNCLRPGLGARADDAVWRAFCDTFGIVWARRVLERFNADAVPLGLTVRLGMHGFERAAPAALAEPVAPADRAVAEQALWRLLERFVDHRWIERQLCSPPAQPSQSAPP